LHANFCEVPCKLVRASVELFVGERLAFKRERDAIRGARNLLFKKVMNVFVVREVRIGLIRRDQNVLALVIGEKR